MKVALIQSALQWENPDANRKSFANKIKSIKEAVDLIVLPEMFTTGFSMHPQEFAETMEGETVRWMLEMADQSRSAICGSVIIKEENHFYNRLIFMLPTGEMSHYDKRHLFALAGEDKVYTSGTARLIVDYNGFKICPLICYDLRFPVFSRNTEDFDLLIYVANWPKIRTNAWDILLSARAVENMCYTIGVNRVGVDANSHEYIGHSQVVDFLGNYVHEPQEKEGIFIVELVKDMLIESRRKLAFLDDRDDFTVLN